MGREVCRAVGAADDLELAAAVDPAQEGERIDRVVGADLGGLVVAGDVERLDAAQIDVAVDFTVVDAMRRNAKWCAAHGVHAVIGTTGWTPADLDTLRTEFDGTGAHALLAPNFALGAVLLMRFCELAAPYMDAVEIIELHHDQKRDAPSGTALRTAEAVERGRRGARCGPLPDDPTENTALAGTRGGSGAGGVRIHSVRLRGLVAHEEVIFGSAGETLTLRHDSLDRVSFMSGVLLGVRQVGSRPGVTVGLDALLGW